jgi:hypothetical protein
MTTPAGNIGLQLDLQIKQGADWSVEVDLTNDDNTTFDLTPYNHVAHLRKKPFASPVISLTVTSPIAGRLRFSLTHTQTAALSCGPDLESDASWYVWDHELVAISGGEITPGFFGDVSVFRDL